jgi:hypothetical protein
MAFLLSSFESIFQQAGVRKNTEEDRWEFISPKKPTVVVSTVTSDNDTPCNSPVKPRKDSEDDEEFHGVNGVDSSPTRANKKKKHRKKKSNTASITKETAGKPKPDRHIQWGKVDEILFERTISFDGVPSQGFYPLGLGEFVEVCTSSVDELFARRQYLEFLASQEKEVAVAKQPASTPKKKGRGGGKKRKDSYDDAAYNSNDAKESADATTTAIVPEDEILPLDAKPVSESIRLAKLAALICENPPHIQELNTEIQAIRDSRAHVGCSCKHVKFDKMNVPTLRSQLSKFADQLPAKSPAVDKMKKADLISHLKEFSKDCKLCIDANCECVQSQVLCSAFGCECLSSECANEFGKDEYDMDRIDVSRKRLIAEYLAQQQLATENGAISIERPSE